ncbi:MAG: type II toxin-antitoxin system HipA family toxin [Desulfuromonadales bacterium]|nr:type II toxin-antitoxin system HipA family toxin [Desulfuromonadales bacterium]
MNEKLFAYLNSHLVGTLERIDEANYLFSYAPAWLENPVRQPLSLALPLQEEAFPPQTSKAFFSNLLPEGEQLREHYATKFRLSSSDDFALLEKLAGDCAGAVSLHPQQLSPVDQTVPQGYRELDDDDLQRLFDQPYIMDTDFLGDEELRLSLAGAQDKLPIAMRNGQMTLPQQGAPSTHILKPQSLRFDSLVENELYCMTLAKEVGLDVPEVFLYRFGDETNYVVERYDRRINQSGRVERIHQEDFCQGTGTSHRNKYQENGGPGHKVCFDVLKQCKNPLADRIKLIDLTVFNYLIGNADCHAKNISLLYPDNFRPILAPCYDLVCTLAYPPLARRLAMGIGGEFDTRNIDRSSWEEFAKEIGEGSAKPTLRALERLAGEVANKTEQTAQGLIDRYGPCDKYGEIVEVILRRVEVAMRQVG